MHTFDNSAYQAALQMCHQMSHDLMVDNDLLPREYVNREQTLYLSGGGFCTFDGHYSNRGEGGELRVVSVSLRLRLNPDTSVKYVLIQGVKLNRKVLMNYRNPDFLTPKSER